MRRHAEEGERIIGHLGFLSDATPAIRHHHEHFDGTGYPDGLEGQAIPLGARILHVADAFDSMITTRVYRAAQVARRGARRAPPRKRAAVLPDAASPRSRRSSRPARWPTSSASMRLRPLRSRLAGRVGVRLLLALAALGAALVGMLVDERQPASVRRERQASLAEGERQGRGARHVPAERRTPAARARVGCAERTSSNGGRRPGAVQVRLRGRLGEVPEREVLEDVQEPVPARTTARSCLCSSPAARRRTGRTGRSSRGSAGSRTSASTPGCRTRRTSSSISRTGPASSRCSRCIRTGRTAERGRGSSAASRTSAMPVHGFSATDRGVPKDFYGRNLHIDTLNSVVRRGLEAGGGHPPAQGHRDVLPLLRSAEAVRLVPEPGDAARRAGRALSGDGERPGRDSGPAGRGARASPMPTARATRSSTPLFDQGDGRRPDLRARALSSRSLTCRATRRTA